MIILRKVSSTNTKLHILRRFSLSIYYLSITSFLYNSSTPILKQIHTRATLGCWLGHATIIMLLQLILALDALAVNAFVMPPNNSTRSIQFQSLVKRTPLPPRDSNFHIPNPGHPRKDAHAFTPHQLQQFKRGHADVMKICLMIIEESEKADRGEKNHFDRAFSRWFALTDEEFVVGQSPMNLFVRLVIRKLTFRRRLQGDRRLRLRQERQPEIRPHQIVLRLHGG
jgi:hypothetical protein